VTDHHSRSGPAGAKNERVSRREPDERRSAALQLLEDRGAATIEHPGGMLLSHLRRTEQTLREWKADEPTCLAGLCHAAYGTQGFPTALVPVASRALLRDMIGAEAEAIVYRYGACDRATTCPGLGSTAATFTDRFTDTIETVTGDDLRAFALVTIANELDLVRLGAFDDETTMSIADLFERLAPYAPVEAELALQSARL
jgi:hypothetical protein